MPPRGRPDDDLVSKDDTPRYRGRAKPPMPPEAPAPTWEPLHVENEHQRGVPNLPAHVSSEVPLELFRLFWSDELVEKIVVYTNKHATISRMKSRSPDEISRSWCPVTASDIYAYLSIVIHMGIHCESRTTDYWRKDAFFGVTHRVTETMSLKRFEQIDRYIYVCPPRDSNSSKFASTFERVYDLSEHIRRASQRYWRPGLNLAVDESMQRFYGRAKETTTIHCKAAGTGYKTWFLGDSGYCLNWRFHTKGSKAGDGPYKLSPYWRSEGFNPTHAVVADMALDYRDSGASESERERLLPAGKHVIWLDNLFTTIKLLERLRRDGVGAAGTVRTSSTPRELKEANANKNNAPESSQDLSPPLPTPPTSQLTAEPDDELPNAFNSTQLTQTQLSLLNNEPEERYPAKLVVCKAWRDQLSWGTIRYATSSTRRVGMFAWRDMSVVLFATTVGNLEETISRDRRRPGATRTGASQTRALFGDHVRLALDIPLLIDRYNHFMGGVDQFDQLRSYYPILRTHRKTWKALLYLLIDITLVNSYKLSSPNSRTDRGAHRKWLLTLVVQLSVFAKPLRKESGQSHRRRALHTNVRLGGLHEQVELGARKTCSYCAAAGKRYNSNSRPSSRPILGEISGNAAPYKRLRRTKMGCFYCQIPICEGSCWSEHLNEVNKQSQYI